MSAINTLKISPTTPFPDSCTWRKSWLSRCDDNYKHSKHFPSLTFHWVSSLAYKLVEPLCWQLQTPQHLPSLSLPQGLSLSHEPVEPLRWQLKTPPTFPQPHLALRVVPGAHAQRDSPMTVTNNPQHLHLALRIVPGARAQRDSPMTGTNTINILPASPCLENRPWHTSR